MDIVAKQVRIVGRVQGVFYRNWTVQTAQALGLVGWVRNRLNGDVEALVQGTEADVARFLELAWTGPPAARVADVADETVEVSHLRGFEQRPTL
jgi:acylphosphatase